MLVLYSEIFSVHLKKEMWCKNILGIFCEAYVRKVKCELL